jgi:hypothetical protein
MSKRIILNLYNNELKFTLTNQVSGEYDPEPSDDFKKIINYYNNGIAFCLTGGEYEGYTYRKLPINANAFFNRFKVNKKLLQVQEKDPLLETEDYIWNLPKGVLFILAPFKGEVMLVDVMTEAQADEMLNSIDSVNMRMEL